jgi:hypothetical protein
MKVLQLGDRGLLQRPAPVPVQQRRLHHGHYRDAEHQRGGCAHPVGRVQHDPAAALRLHTCPNTPKAPADSIDRGFLTSTTPSSPTPDATVRDPGLDGAATSPVLAKQLLSDRCGDEAASDEHARPTAGLAWLRVRVSHHAQDSGLDSPSAGGSLAETAPGVSFGRPSTGPQRALVDRHVPRRPAFRGEARRSFSRGCSRRGAKQVSRSTIRHQPSAASRRWRRLPRSSRR